MRYRVEIYDEVKANDLTLFSELKVDKDQLTEMVFNNLNNFDGTINAYVIDNKSKKKITALYLPMEIINTIKSKSKNTAEILGL